MLRKIILLFKIARKLGKSDALNIISNIYKPPIFMKLFFLVFGFELNKSINIDKNKTPGQRLCISIQEMGTTFIKLGQFLATRPDIIGKHLARDLEILQDKLPAFSTSEAKVILKEMVHILIPIFKLIREIYQTHYGF